MKIWTYQRKDKVIAMEKSGLLCPNFKEDEIFGCSKNAYFYILDEYNKHSGTLNNGLIFSFIGNYQHPSIESKEELETMLKEVGNPFGTSFSSDTHCLLELEIPDDVYKLVIDFYLFTDLMFFMEEKDEAEIAWSKKVLYEKNIPEGYQLPIAHFPCIKKIWVKNIHDF